MSMLSGIGGGSGYSAKPGKAPHLPKRNDENIDDITMRRIRKLQSSNSYAKALLYSSGKTAGAPAPVARSIGVFGAGE